MSGVLSLAARLGQGCKREPFPVAFGPRAARAPGNIRGHFSRTKSHRRAQSGWDSLTLTESKIAELVEEGLSNPEIAAKLCCPGALWQPTCLTS